MALEGLENILRVGKDEAQKLGQTDSEYRQAVEAAGGLDKIEQLQAHAQPEIYEKANQMIEQYFGYAEADQSLKLKVGRMSHHSHASTLCQGPNLQWKIQETEQRVTPRASSICPTSDISLCSAAA